MTLRNKLGTGFAALAVSAVPFALAASPAAACTDVSPAPGGSAPSGPAVSCTLVTETVSGGNLTLTGPATATGGAITLGADQTSTYSLATLATGDNTGSGNGWNEAIAQTQFTTGTHTLPTSETIAPGSFTAVGASTLPTSEGGADILTAVTATNGTVFSEFADRSEERRVGK